MQYPTIIGAFFNKISSDVVLVTATVTATITITTATTIIIPPPITNFLSKKKLFQLPATKIKKLNELTFWVCESRISHLFETLESSE